MLLTAKRCRDWPWSNGFTWQYHVSCSSFSAALVSHEITHASWPSRPQKEKGNELPRLSPGGWGWPLLILRWKQRQFEKSMRHPSVSHTYVSCSSFSAALVSHEITHASWPSRPQKEKGNELPRLSQINCIKMRRIAAPHPGIESSSQINRC